MREPLPSSGQFVGRGKELAWLALTLARAREGSPQVVSVEGIAGIGKTSLVRRFLAGAPAGKVGTPLWGSGDEGETSLPWGVLGQLARSAADQGLPKLSKLVAGLDPQADPVMVGAGLLGLVGETGDELPLVVVVDDMHWSDPQSLAALRFAFRRPARVPITGPIATRTSGVGTTFRAGGAAFAPLGPITDRMRQKLVPTPASPSRSPTSGRRHRLVASGYRARAGHAAAPGVGSTREEKFRENPWRLLRAGPLRSSGMSSNTPWPVKTGSFSGPPRGARFVVDVSWNAEGALEGLIGLEGADPGELVPFWGVAELVGLLQARIGPAAPAPPPRSPAP